MNNTGFTERLCRSATQKVNVVLNLQRNIKRDQVGGAIVISKIITEIMCTGQMSTHFLGR